MFRKKYNYRGKWGTVSLNKEEVNKETENLRQENIELMKLCINDVKRILPAGVNLTDTLKVGISLFDKIVDKKFTRMECLLSEKTELAEQGEIPKTKEVMRLKEEKINFDSQQTVG